MKGDFEMTLADAPLVSVVINNYNYGRYLGQAIESALQQSYPCVEVIVVDDGSTDGSREVIGGYGRRIIPVYQENGGQASALNAGFQESQGEIVLFLDADDMLRPEIVEAVVERFAADPSLVKVQYRLALVDGDGASLGRVMPPRERPMPNGYLRQQVLTYPDDISWLPTSGNAFAAEALGRIFPIPEAEYPICADYYLLNLSALLGPVASLEQVGGCYRVHGSNADHRQGVLDLERTRRTIRLTERTHHYIRQWARQQGVRAEPASLTYLSHRLISLRLARPEHPVAGDRVWGLVRQGVRAAWGRRDRPVRARLAFMLWFGLLAVGPRPVVRWLGKRFLI
jgi:glycosyltransferase involved in cell wall biosynthesis